MTSLVTFSSSIRRRELSRKRAMIMFYALRCGTAYEDLELIEFTEKTAPDGVAFDDGEDGVVSERRGGCGRKREKME